jgi:hypothetical protein
MREAFREASRHELRAVAGGGDYRAQTRQEKEFYDAEKVPSL